MANEENLKSYKPGQSGNPSGRPKGAKNIETKLRELMEVTLESHDPLTGKAIKMKAGDMIYAQLVAKAAKDGDLSAIDKVFDRLEGKPVQRNKDETEISFMDNLNKAKELENKDV